MDLFLQEEMIYARYFIIYPLTLTDNYELAIFVYLMISKLFGPTHFNYWELFRNCGKFNRSAILTLRYGRSILFCLIFTCKLNVNVNLTKSIKSNK